MSGTLGLGLGLERCGCSWYELGAHSMGVRVIMELADLEQADLEQADYGTG
jgi:hypothetical protein